MLSLVAYEIRYIVINKQIYWEVKNLNFVWLPKIRKVSKVLLCFQKLLKRFHVKRIFHYVKIYNGVKITIFIECKFPSNCFGLN